MSDTVRDLALLLPKTVNRVYRDRIKAFIPGPLVLS